jgi:hypothetical protein
MAYTVLAAVLAWTRLVGLERSYWFDELFTVTEYMRAGPRQILAGPYLPNNHELFSLLGWATTSMIGESEVALRLFSAIPFILGVILVTAWLHVRVNPLSGVFFLFFATASPLLFDVSRQARGYGLAFLAMSVLVVAALEAERTGRTRALLAFLAAGLVGTWTLPIFVLAFVATTAVLLLHRPLRRRVAIGAAGSAFAIAMWYAPHADDLLEASGQQFGARIPWLGLLVAPVDRLLIPGMLWFGGTFLTTYPMRFFVVVALALLLVSSPLLRQRTAAMLVGSGVILTLICIWAARLYLEPRFVSYLLVPLFMLLASGTAHVTIHAASRRSGIRALIVMTTVTVALAAFAGSAALIMRLPGEAWKDAASVIETSAPPDAPVLAHVSHPLGLAFYLEAPVEALQTSEVRSRVCGNRRTVVYVMQPYNIEPLVVPCLRREGVRFYRLRQHSRGGEINVWVVPSR